MKKMLLLLPLFLLAFDREAKIKEIDALIALYKKRILCLKKEEVVQCLQRYPQDPHADALARSFAMSFPKSYYQALLKRHIKRLQAQKLCYGKALNRQEAKKCANF